MTMPKNLGMIVLAVWLILFGLLTAPFLGLSFSHSGDILRAAQNDTMSRYGYAVLFRYTGDDGFVAREGCMCVCATNPHKTL